MVCVKFIRDYTEILTKKIALCKLGFHVCDQEATCTMTSFYTSYQNSLGFCFLVQIAHFFNEISLVLLN